MFKIIFISLGFLFLDTHIFAQTASDFISINQTSAYSNYQLPTTSNTITFQTYKPVISNIQKQLIVPSLLISYGFGALPSTELRELNQHIQSEILEDSPQFKTGFDNYLQFSPAAATFALKLAGHQGQNNIWTSSKLYFTSSLLMAGTVYALKNICGEIRPDNSAHNSFPSGHTATAFAGAEFMHQEFKNSAPILSYSGYLAAGATGVLRMYNNRHYLSDVIAGAGIGIITTKAAYYINEKLFTRTKKHSF